MDDTVKEEEVDFNPDIEEETDIVGDFLGVEVETCDLLGIEESGQPSSSTLPDDVQGAAEGAPLEIVAWCNEASASAEPDTTTGEVT